MLSGILTGIITILMLVIDLSLWFALPLPWRLISLSLVVGLALMHRISLELGLVLVVLHAVLLYAAGMLEWTALLAVAITSIMSILLYTRIFARRSLAAFAGFAFVTSAIFSLLRFGILSPALLFFASGMTALLAVVASLAFQWFITLFAARFVQKDAAYAVEKR